MTKRIATLAIAATMALGFALPAVADVYETGSINCSPNNLAVQSYSVGTTKHFVPSSTQIASWANSTWTYRTSTTFQQSSTWKVSSAGSLSDPGTYAYCWGS